MSGSDRERPVARIEREPPRARIERDRSPSRPIAVGEREVALVDLVDRLLGGGVVIAGDITLAVADVDLVYVSLRALVSSVATAEEKGVLPRMGSAL
ncbi:MAG TPA: gas vesicle protein [Solirubrobacteraceae bacterium]|nr:gas vesicle protein [Solirubrobacteraceae bacterium]